MEVDEVVIFITTIDPCEREAYFQQGWLLSHVRKRNWGTAYYLKHEEV